MISARIFVARHVRRHTHVIYLYGVTNYQGSTETHNAATTVASSVIPLPLEAIVRSKGGSTFAVCISAIKYQSETNKKPKNPDTESKSDAVKIFSH